MVSPHVVPVLFGAVTQMFEHLGPDHIQLEAVDAIASPTAGRWC